MVWGVRSATTKTAVAAALIGMATTGATVPVNATSGFTGTSYTPAPLDDPNPGVPTNPYDPQCAVMPELAQCQGGPYAHAGGPMGPSDSPVHHHA